ncbi:cytosine deaminase [Nguyenibacter sp. L1]|uniref:cytosine deaminase n=1 Tax=Nguyenibacter sp. L1 TaxID=3049350 RepID=UPI002B46B001|nr:cytosine deaminase [Nguyenibacter sp. L1]WRH88774.1 cytosine deaminase [Nguyenibacter sp. L1]
MFEMSGSRHVLRRARIPAALTPWRAPGDGGGEWVECDIVIADGRIAALERLPPESGMPETDLAGGMVWPAFADIHTHLDKAFIWDRAPNPDGTFAGAVQAVTADRERHWTEQDVRRRMEFALASAHAHGTRAIRTHLDIAGAHGRRVWPLIRALQAEWAGRVALQAVALVMPEAYDGAQGAEIARAAAGTPGGMLGAVLMGHNTGEAVLDRLFGLARDHGLDLDLHVDENGEAGETALEQVAAASARHRFAGRVVCGHCCSLSVQQAARARDIAARVADAGIGVVSLPQCNLYLQDRAAGATPRWRGITLVHELADAGADVMFASDNVRDPFHAYGDFDMMTVFGAAVRIAHLDHPFGAWPAAVTGTPMRRMGLGDGMIRPGAPADLVLFEARTMNELLSRPDRRAVVRGGRAIAERPPSYRELP